MSTELRPGLALPDGRMINLDVTSPLFLGSLFSGNLDGGGFATASIPIPPQVPAGTRVFASAAEFVASAPGCLVTANTWAFSVD